MYKISKCEVNSKIAEIYEENKAKYKMYEDGIRELLNYEQRVSESQPEEAKKKLNIIRAAAKAKLSQPSHISMLLNASLVVVAIIIAIISIFMAIGKIDENLLLVCVALLAVIVIIIGVYTMCRISNINRAQLENSNYQQIIEICDTFEKEKLG